MLSFTLIGAKGTSRTLGRSGEPPRRFSACGVSPAPSSRRSLAPFAPINLVTQQKVLHNKEEPGKVAGSSF
jgi:hypothetical protein